MPAEDESEEIRRTWDGFPAAFRGEDVGPYLERIDPDVEWIPIAAALEGRVYRGHEGVVRWLEELRRDWEEFEPVPGEIQELGGGHFLVLGHWRARGRGSGVELTEQPAAWLMHRREGKICRLQTFTDRREALEAAELARKRA